MDPDLPPTLTWESPPADLVRVEDPDYPGALARTDRYSLLSAPPVVGVPWQWETMAVPDGWPGDAGLSVTNADLWHARGWRGQGVKVAMFDLQWYGAELDPGVLGDVTTADCWSHPSCELPMDLTVARNGYESGIHGFACADVVRDIAPDVDLYLVRVSGYSTFASAVDWAIRHDIQVVSLSMSFFNESFYDGTGPFERLVAKMAAHHILLVASSGNYQKQHWSGPYVDADQDGRLDFDGSNRLPVQFGAGRKGMYINWDEHWSCGGSDLDARIVGADGTIYGDATVRQSKTADSCSPVEHLGAEIPTDGTYYLEILGMRVQGTNLEVDVFTTSGSIPGGVKEDSLTDPGSSPLAFTVAAVRASNYLTNDVEGFSSWGPGRADTPKPDIAGPDGLSTEAYGGGAFFGTSASTPAVAATVALVLSRYPDLTPQEAATKLQGWAWNPENIPDDPRWGAGKVRLPDPDAEAPTGCGSSQGWMGLILPSLGWFRRRARKAPTV